MLTDEQRTEIARFLRLRRERLQPADVGLPPTGRRRTPGLRREEVAQLAGISAEWYRWLEQGRPVRASRRTLRQVAAALRLEPAEQRHLLRLSRYEDSDPARDPGDAGVSLQLRRLLAEMRDCPAYVLGRRWDYLAWNDAAVRVFGDFGRLAELERNCLWQSLVGPRSRMLRDWEYHARALVHGFRAQHAKHLGESWFEELIEALHGRSGHFSRWWNERRVRGWEDGVKCFSHPGLGELAFEHTGFDLADERLAEARLITYVPLDDDTRRRLVESRS